MANKITMPLPEPPASVPLLPKLMAESADPRDQWAEQTRIIIDSSREFRQLQDEHPEAAVPLLKKLVGALDQALLAAYRDGDRARGDELVAGFSYELRRAVVSKIRELLPRTAADEVQGRHMELARNAWAAREMDNLREMLLPGETLTDIAPTALTTSSGRTITRQQVRSHGRPASWANDENWLSQFTSDVEVQRIAAQNAARKAPPTPSSGPRTRDGQPLQYGADGKPLRRW